MGGACWFSWELKGVVAVVKYRWLAGMRVADVSYPLSPVTVCTVIVDLSPQFYHQPARAHVSTLTLYALGQ